jgi:site-specific DNA-methyltransferase (adenine-specific)
MTTESIDSIVTDPPAGIAFMGKDWDKDKGGRDKWIEWMTTIASECLRVLKPGGHAVVWSLPRTSHWTATAWEDAGFEVRDRIAHVFGSGFPKSLNVSKKIDKMAGAEREVVGKYQLPNGQEWNLKQSEDESVEGSGGTFTASKRRTLNITAPATSNAEQWEGWGTALKPAIEDWWLFRKPLSEKTVVENVLKWGTGALNIDVSRVPMTNIDKEESANNWKPDGYKLKNSVYEFGTKVVKTEQPKGRWPAQLIHDGSDEVIGMFPKTNGDSPHRTPRGHIATNGVTSFGTGMNDKPNRTDSGSTARFFYCAKPSRSERDEGLDDMASKSPAFGNDKGDGLGSRQDWLVKNTHPTVKPLALMRYLITLVTPPKGIVLDCFCGSGTTGVAAIQLGFEFIGIDEDKDYCEIAKKRIENYG